MAQEIVLIDINRGAAEGSALDIQEAAPCFRFDTRLSGSDQLADMEGAGLIVVTAGFARKPGMSRSDVLGANLNIIDGICDAALRHAPNAMMIMVTNPVDVLTYRAYQRTGWPRSRVFGQAGVLDSSRMATFVSLETGFSVREISCMVLGGHGDVMVPLIRYSTISGIPMSHFLDREALDRIIERTRTGGAEILALKQNSSAYQAPAASVAAMVDAIVRGRRHITPCVVLLEGEYDQDDIAMGVPCVLGKGGMEQIVILTLDENERRMMATSADQIRGDLAQIPQD